MTRKKNGKYIEQTEVIDGKKYVTVYNAKTKEVILVRELKR